MHSNLKNAKVGDLIAATSAKDVIVAHIFNSPLAPTNGSEVEYAVIYEVDLLFYLGQKVINGENAFVFIFKDKVVYALEKYGPYFYKEYNKVAKFTSGKISGKFIKEHFSSAIFIKRR